MKTTFLIRVAIGGRLVTVPAVASCSIDALLHVLGSLEARGVTIRGGSVCLSWRNA